MKSEFDLIVSYARIRLWLSRVFNILLFSSLILLGLKSFGVISVSYLLIILFWLTAITLLAINPWFDLKAEEALSRFGIDKFESIQLVEDIDLYIHKYDLKDRRINNNWRSFVKHLPLEDRKIAYVYLAKLKQKVKIKDIDRIFYCDRMMRIVSKNL